MEKELNSGIRVDGDQYYKLLEWKDANMKKFIFFCQEYHITPSLNEMSMEDYMAVLQFANLD